MLFLRLIPADPETVSIAEHPATYLLGVTYGVKIGRAAREQVLILRLRSSTPKWDSEDACYSHFAAKSAKYHRAICGSDSLHNDVN